MSKTKGQTPQHPKTAFLHNSWGKTKTKLPRGTMAFPCPQPWTRHTPPRTLILLFPSHDVHLLALSLFLTDFLQTVFSKLSLRKLQAFLRDCSLSADLPPFPGTALELSIWSHCLISEFSLKYHSCNGGLLGGKRSRLPFLFHFPQHLALGWTLDDNTSEKVTCFSNRNLSLYGFYVHADHEI